MIVPDRLPRGMGSLRRDRGKWVGLLPRHLSKAPKGCKDPENYRERLEGCDTKEEAYRLLVACVKARTDGPESAPIVSSFRVDAEETIERLRSDAFRRYGTEAGANKSVSTPKGVLKNWLSDEPWLDLPTKLITKDDLQETINHIVRTGRTEKGKPVSAEFVRHVAKFLRAVFDDRNIEPNPTAGLRLPPKKPPAVHYWSLRQHRVFFGAAEIELKNRIMAGCGMGLGLRVNELLSLEVDDVHLDGSDPHVIVQYGGPDRAPTKGTRVRRVELFEPGLGFLRIWMAEFYEENHLGLVFAGARGGYQKHWPNQFPEWGEALALRHSTSHIMRHSYAVAMLSGTWGYEPQSLEFVSKQLGHADVATTERYYGQFEQETWKRQVRRMTGREERPNAREAITASELLGRTLVREEAEVAEIPLAEVDPRRPPSVVLSTENHSVSIQSLVRTRTNPRAVLAETFLERVAAGDPHALRLGIELAQAVIEDAVDAEVVDQSGKAVGK